MAACKGEVCPSEGLEEGEVEGETLLMVEGEEHGSLDLSHDHSNESLTSDVGEDMEGWTNEEMSFCCERCHRWIPTGELCGDPPSYLKGDNFFRLSCSECSEDGTESFTRIRLTWQQVVMLAMYNLSLEGTGRQGYFRWKEDICAFIGRHWNFLLGSRKKTSTWWSTVAGCLSVGSPAFFRSGAQEFGEPGWWKLVQNRPPTLRPEMDRTGGRTKAMVRPTTDPLITVEGLRRRGLKSAVQSAMQLKEKRSRTQEAKDIRRAQKEAGLEKGEVVDFSSLSSSDRTPLTSPSPSPDLSGPGTPASHSATPSLLSEADLIPDAMPPQALFHDDEEVEGMIDPGMENLPPLNATRRKLRPPPPHIKREAGSEEEEGTGDDMEVGSGHGDCAAMGVSRPDRKRVSHPEKDNVYQNPRLTALGPYQETMLLRRLNACPLALAITPNAKRLRRKLLLRQTKRQRGLPVLDVDQAVSLVGGAYGQREVGRTVCYRAGNAEHRILDRFQSGLSIRPCVLQQSMLFWNRLMGAEGSLDQTIRSPYTSRLLKPFIRRDYESRPLKMRLLAEIRAFAHRSDPGWSPGPEAPIDYCYISPAHIPSVNSMCQHSFWPGVDLSESLQYPDFSVVALYRKVVVGFGFMVPDVKFNEAYISFLLVHPEWRRSGIGTFIIYHLIQTCMGKDVTLHVSLSNPAMLLYQKFGFKAEELILDFYDKYFPAHSSECRHAFLLRLRR
ncbi:cysteine-rich protein 2-binding protein [Gouania willdenowi]|uniref:cysteine-rich protein 2-binding protein n=1 Tax=Gouania willdenowi TaxID=441366 RepID=UPI001056617F|nr:cysteine-rich protein 2-binding protein [Gouania willdenowi]